MSLMVQQESFKAGWLALSETADILPHSNSSMENLIIWHSKSLYDALYSVHPYNTRGAASGHIRFSQSFSGEQTSFKGRARKVFNEVPMDIRTGTLPTVKRKLKNWIMNNVPLDWS